MWHTRSLAKAISEDPFGCYCEARYSAGMLRARDESRGIFGPPMRRGPLAEFQTMLPSVGCRYREGDIGQQASGDAAAANPTEIAIIQISRSNRERFAYPTPLSNGVALTVIVHRGFQGNGHF